MTKITKERFILACKDSGGLQSSAAQKLGVDRSAITHYLERNPEMQKYLDDAFEVAGDVLASGMVIDAKNGNFKARKFLLETLYKNRGYTTKQEVEHTGVMQQNIVKVSVEELEEQFKKIDEKRKNASDKEKTD